MIELPSGITRSDVNDEPFVLYPPDSNGIEAVRQYVVGCLWGWFPTKVKAMAFFNADALLDVSDNRPVQLQVVGRLNSGQYFVCSDTIRIFTPLPPPRPCSLHNRRK
jgi:hypothetical protein